MADHLSHLTSPEMLTLDWIEGAFPVFTVQPGDRFRVILGSLDNHSDCDGGFVLNYPISDGPLQNLGRGL